MLRRKHRLFIKKGMDIMYQNFEYYAPTKVVFGQNTEHQVGDLVKKFDGKKVMIHYGGHSAFSSGLLDRVKKSLDDADIAYVELGGVVPNPHLSKIYEGIELGRKENVDFLLAVGGGSVIDSAKAIALGLANPQDDVWDYFIHKKTPDKSLPIASVLTIAAAGSEMSGGSVVTNEKNGLKRSCGGDFMRPKFAVMNPELTMTLPPYQTACGAVDIMMHTMERFFNQKENMEIVDSISVALMKNVMKYAKILMKEPNNYNARAEMMLAGSLSHNGLTGCATGGGDWATHDMEHELGGMYDVAHGAGLAAIWGSWARYVCHQAPHRFEKFALEVMEVEHGKSQDDTIEKGIKAMEDFYREIGMPTNIAELGVHPTDEQIRFMANSCAEAGGGKQGVVSLTPNDIEKIYHNAL